MNTDILCEIVFPKGQEVLAMVCLEQAFTMMRDFERRYSRFEEGNDLWQLNQSEHMELSEEFFDLLTKAKYFYEKTNGIFDPSILSALEQEGYVSNLSEHPTSQKRNFSELMLNPLTRSAHKPKDLRIDLGGIGKGYIVDRVAAFLSQHFENFLIDAGGDIAVRGGNQKEDSAFWGIEVEHPSDTTASLALLLLTNQAIATSGRNRRHWKKNGEEKHHLIDPTTGKSAQSDFISVTVIAPDTTTADILAKTLFIAGRKQAPLLAEQFHIPAIFVADDGTVTLNHFAEPYAWKAH